MFSFYVVSVRLLPIGVDSDTLKVCILTIEGELKLHLGRLVVWHSASNHNLPVDRFSRMTTGLGCFSWFSAHRRQIERRNFPSSFFASVNGVVLMGIMIILLLTGWRVVRTHTHTPHTARAQERHTQDRHAAQRSATLANHGKASTVSS